MKRGIVSQRAFLEVAKAKDAGVILACSPGRVGREQARSSLAGVLVNPQISAMAVDMDQPGDVDTIVQVLSAGQAAA